MPVSLRAQAYLRREAERKRQHRAEQLQAVELERKNFHRDYLDRTRAAAALGVSVHALKRWQLSGRGPTPTKMGAARQARTFWHRQEIARYLADPVKYENSKPAQSSAG